MDYDTPSAVDVATEIRKRMPGVPLKKLHKLLYYCQGFHLAAMRRPLFVEEIEAWDRGPVVPDVWRLEKHGQATLALQTHEAQVLGEAELNTVGYVLSRYGTMTGADLEALTHHERPWMFSDQRRQLTGNQLMDVEEIQAFIDRVQQEDDEDDEHDYVPPANLVQEWLASAPERRADDLSKDDIGSLRALARQ
ncbi:MAG: hypothetical protein JWM76_345 [Pseudonocardiales bacterium]|nr:hypothetical protein [Pseudonocardiales bacterium]